MAIRRLSEILRAVIECRALPWIVFLFVSVLAVVIKSHHEPLRLLEILQNGGQPLERGYLTSTDVGLPLSLRFGGALVYQMVEWLLEGLSHFMMITPETSIGFVGTPWGHKAYDAMTLNQIVRPLLSVHVYQIILLIPIVLCAQQMFIRPLTQAIFVFMTLICYGGWPPILVNALFSALNAIADWPRAYYMFADRLIPSDVSILSILFLLTLWLSRPQALTLPHVAAVTALAQITAEHLGFVTGVAICLRTFAADGVNKKSTIQAARQLAVAGTVSAVLLIAITVFVLNRQEWIFGGDGSLAGSWQAYWAEKYAKYGYYNLLWLNVIVANFISFLMLPVLAGLIIGGWCYLRDGRAGASDPQSQFMASGSVMLALILAMGLGASNSGYSSDLGRQATPLACLLILVVAKGVQTLLIRIRT